MEPAGNRSPAAAPHNVYKCKGGNRWCAITVDLEAEWRALKKAMGLPDWAEDDKFNTQAGRKANEIELDKRITAWTRKFTAEKLGNILQEQGIASGIVQDAFDIFIDPQLKSRGFFMNAPDGEFGLIDVNPIRLNEAGARYENAAPAPGQDNDYVYGKLLFMTRKEIETLRKKGVI